MGFYDAKGYWRSDGDGFYDAKGNWVSPGGAFYDGKGYLRSPGDGFYDAKGNWVSPGGAFYDGRGVLQSSAGAVGVVGTSGEANGAVVGVLFLLSLPVVALWILTVRLIGWVSSHLYLVFGGYLLLTATISYAITRRRKHRGLRAALSFTGSCLCLLSLAYIALVYAVPYVILHGGSFGDFFEFTAALAVGTAAVAILQFFNYYHGNAVWELILGVLFFCRGHGPAAPQRRSPVASGPRRHIRRGTHRPVPVAVPSRCPIKKGLYMTAFAVIYSPFSYTVSSTRSPSGPTTQLS